MISTSEKIFDAIREEQKLDEAANRDYNRQSLQISEYGDGHDYEANELLQITNQTRQKDRLDYFTKDSDYYTSLLLYIVSCSSEAGLPPEITTTLEPVREKC